MWSPPAGAVRRRVCGLSIRSVLFLTPRITIIIMQPELVAGGDDGLITITTTAVRGGGGIIVVNP